SPDTHPLSLHDALPIWDLGRARAAFFAIVRERRARFSRTAARLTTGPLERRHRQHGELLGTLQRRADQATATRLDRLRARLTQRSEEHTSELQSRENLV